MNKSTNMSSNCRKSDSALKYDQFMEEHTDSKTDEQMQKYKLAESDTVT